MKTLRDKLKFHSGSAVVGVPLIDVAWLALGVILT